MEEIPIYSDKLALDAQGAVAADLPCIRCGYNLRGLSPDGACPECGTAVGRSALGDFLRFSDPAWVGTLASGMNFIVAGIVISFILGLSIGVMAAVRLLPQPVAQLITLVPAVLALIGYWKVTTPDPGRLEADSPTSARNIVRVTQIASFVIAVAHLSLNRLFPYAAAVILVVQQIIGLINFFAVFTYARSLALRIPDTGLAGQTRVVMWGLVSSTIICIVVMVTMLSFTLPLWGSTGHSPMGGAGYIAGGLGLFGGFGVLVFAIWSLVLIDMYRRRFKKAANEASTTWAATPAIAAV